MPKHAKNNPDDFSGREEDHIGLTEAFSPIPSDSSSEESSDENHIGLTEAFAPVANARGSHARGVNYQGDTDEKYPSAFDNMEPRDPSALQFSDDVVDVTPQDVQAGHGKKEKPQLSAPWKKSRRTRKILIFVVVVLIGLIAALGYFGYQWFEESQNLASQQVIDQQSSQEVDAMKQDESATSDASVSTTKKTSAPELVSLLGLTEDEALDALGSGATVTKTEEVEVEGSDDGEADSEESSDEESSDEESSDEVKEVTTYLTLALSDEPVDSTSGSPGVYLTIDQDGVVVEAGYSVAVALLGYGSSSFSDAILVESIIENTLEEAGLVLEEGAVVLPEDKTEYTEYASDETTVTKEKHSFSGTAESDGVEYEWSAVLLYDYSMANLSGNLSDTVRLVYIYINA